MAQCGTWLERTTSHASKYLPEVVIHACRNFEDVFEVHPGSAYGDWADEQSFNAAGWSEAFVADDEEIDKAKAVRLSDSPIGGCTSVGSRGSLYFLAEKTSSSLNNVSPSEWVLINVIANSVAYETALPASLCAAQCACAAMG